MSIIIYKSILFLAITISAVFSQTNLSCEWKDPKSGTSFNFCSLKKDPSSPWKVKDGADNGLFSMVYIFNIGDNSNQKCKGKAVAVSEFLEVLKQPTDTCEVLGQLDQKTVSLLDENNPKAGISVTYSGGDICTNGEPSSSRGKPRSSRFKIYCSSSQDANFVLDLPNGSQGTTKCQLDFKINSPAGCPGGSLGLFQNSFSILIWLTIIFSVYMSVGVVYNIKKNNLSGKDAIPNIEFWREFPALIQDGLATTINTVKNGVNFIKAKLTGSNSSSYNEL